MKLKLLFTVFTLSTCAITINAQTQYSGWLATFESVKLGKHTSISADAQLRSSDELAHVATLLLRAGLTYHAGKKIQLTTGYALVHNRRVVSGISGYVDEHRIWEQLIYNHKAGPVNLTHRVRLEQRFIGKAVPDGDQLDRNGHAYASRFRYFIRNVLPFRAQTTFTKGLFAALQDEAFLNIGNKANVNGKTFDQNRLYLAIGYRVSKEMDVEAGYLNQYISGVAGRTLNHVAQAAVYFRL